MGVPIALVLTGFLWHLVGVANAVLQQQALRLAADTAAYEGAVWHARGMNIIACLNLLMESMAAAVTAYELLAHTLLVSLATVCPPGACDRAASAELGEKLIDGLPKVEAWTRAQVAAISRLERITATVTPGIALRQREVRASSFATASTLFGLSMVPDSKLPSVLVPATERMNLGRALPSLPVKVGRQKDLCLDLVPLTVDVNYALFAALDATWSLKLLDSSSLDYKAKWAIAASEKANCLYGGEFAALWTPAGGSPAIAFDVQGFAIGKRDSLQQDADNVGRLVHDGSPALLVSPKNPWTGSQATFGFACSSRTPDDCAETALYSPTWSATLTRVRPLPGFGGSAFASSMATSLLLAVSTRAIHLNEDTHVSARLRELVH